MEYQLDDKSAELLEKTAASDGAQGLKSDEFRPGVEFMQELLGDGEELVAFFERRCHLEAVSLLRSTRISRNLTQKDLAERLSVDRKAVTALENHFSRNTITIRSIHRYLLACGYILELRAVPLSEAIADKIAKCPSERSENIQPKKD